MVDSSLEKVLETVRLEISQPVARSRIHRWTEVGTERKVREKSEILALEGNLKMK